MLDRGKNHEENLETKDYHQAVEKGAGKASDDDTEWCEHSGKRRKNVVVFGIVHNI